MSASNEYIITAEQIEEINRAHGGMKTVTSWLSCYAIWDTDTFPMTMKSEHIAVTLPEIVRCIDCKRFDTDDYGCTWCSWVCAAVSPDDYCSWGERKADE